MIHKKLQPRHHTGKLVHRHHTSYVSLLALLAAISILLFSITRSVVFAAPEDPITESYGTYAAVIGPAPASAPVITNISDGAVFRDAESIDIEGACPSDTLVKVFKNNVLAGTAFCQSGRFSLKIDLFLGQNALVLKAYNANDKPGPDSVPINVRQEVLGTATPISTNINNQFFITSEARYQGFEVGRQVSWPITISGGQSPYALSISWGDDKTDVISHPQAGKLDIKHIYDKPGTGYKGSYIVTITGADQNNDRAFLQLVTIVPSNSPSVANTIKQGYNWSGALRTAWQLLILAIVIALSFWLGERREIYLYKKRGIRLA